MTPRAGTGSGSGLRRVGGSLQLRHRLGPGSGTAALQQPHTTHTTRGVCHNILPGQENRGTVIRCERCEENKQDVVFSSKLMKRNADEMISVRLE